MEIERKICNIFIKHPQTRELINRMKLRPEAFNDNFAKEVFTQIYRLNNEGKIFDSVTISSLVDPVGLMKLMIGNYSPDDLDTDLEILKDRWAKRDIHGLSENVLVDMLDEDKSGVEIATDYINRLVEIIEQGSTIKEEQIGDGFRAAMKTIDENIKRGSIGLSTGFFDIDGIFDGFAPKELTYLAARPREGKTTLALNFAKNIAKNGDPVLFFSLEMGKEQIWFKIISSEINQEVSKIRKGEVSFKSLDMSIAEIPLYVIDEAGISVEELTSICKTYARTKGVKAVFVDYLQLLSTKGRFSNREQEVGKISRRLKKLAMMLDLPVIALSQLNRDKHRSRYTLSDLRESGSLEQDADNIMFIYYPFIHHQMTYDFKGQETTFTKGEAVFSIAKYRLGDPSECKIKFIGEHSKFTDFDSQFFNEAPF